MGTIRQKINFTLLSPDNRLLQTYGVTSDKDHLTDVGRRVVLDILFEDKELRKTVIGRLKDVKTMENEED